jgi:hypothetical protein
MVAIIAITAIVATTDIAVMVAITATVAIMVVTPNFDFQMLRIDSDIMIAMVAAIEAKIEN